MKYLLLTIIIFQSIFFSSCSESIYSDTDTVSGSILVSTTNVKVGVFHDDLSIYGYSSGDEVTSIYGGTAPYVPIVLGTISGDSYTITFPEDENTMGAFIAWIDTNNDNLLAESERAYFPMKYFNEKEYVVTITYYLGYSTRYVEGIYAYIDSLDTVGTSGFNFTID